MRCQGGVIIEWDIEYPSLNVTTDVLLSHINFF